MVSGWTKGDDFLRLTIGSADLRVRVYPVSSIGFFFTGGLGAGMIRLSPGPATQGNAITRFGHAFLGGAGCDFHVSRRASVTLYADGSGVRTWGENQLSADVWKLGLGATLR